jgi:hypothetical protein
MPATQAGPAQKSRAGFLDLIKPELAQPDDVEQGPEFRPDLLLADNRRPRVVEILASLVPEGKVWTLLRGGMRGPRRFLGMAS